MVKRVNVIFPCLASALTLLQLSCIVGGVWKSTVTFRLTGLCITLQHCEDAGTRSKKRCIALSWLALRHSHPYTHTEGFEEPYRNPLRYTHIFGRTPEERGHTHVCPHSVYTADHDIVWWRQTELVFCSNKQFCLSLSVFQKPDRIWEGGLATKFKSSVKHRMPTFPHSCWRKWDKVGPMRCAAGALRVSHMLDKTYLMLVKKWTCQHLESTAALCGWWRMRKGRQFVRWRHLEQELFTAS